VLVYCSQKEETIYSPIPTQKNQLLTFKDTNKLFYIADCDVTIQRVGIVTFKW
jgi:hypothetical protein